jgi:uncharacterized protein YgiM (DUF1202 family)
MIVTYLTLFWVAYEISGGADFEPSQREVTSAAPWHTNRPATQIADTSAAQPTDIQVTRRPSAAYEIIPASLNNEPETPAGMYAAAEDVVEVEEVAKVDLRLVVGDRVNMREGPSTNHLVLDTLSRGTQADVIAISGDGWAQIRLIDSGETGWMAERLLSGG